MRRGLNLVIPECISNFFDGHAEKKLASPKGLLNYLFYSGFSILILVDLDDRCVLVFWFQLFVILTILEISLFVNTAAGTG